MRPVNFDKANITFTKPEDMTDEECVPLHAWRGPTIKGNNCVVTAWMPSKEDLEALNRGEPLWLQVHGGGIPPLAMFTEYPWED